MGNSLGFVKTHARRFKNRYNAQYKAIEFISKENRSSAPKYPVPTEVIAEDPSRFQELQKKDLNLAAYLKEVYVLAHDKKPQDCPQSRENPERPLPESRESKPNVTFVEPEEVERGWCTITHISDFLASHEEDPLRNSAAAIAEKYDLEEGKVENTLKYFSVFRVFDRTRDTLPSIYEKDQSLSEAEEEMKREAKNIMEYSKSKIERLSGGRKQEASPSESDEGSQSVEKAIKN